MLEGDHHGIFKGVDKCKKDEIATHQISCEGKFRRVFEITRTVNGNIEKKYVTHKKFVNPTVIVDVKAPQNMHMESIDISSDYEAPKNAEFTDKENMTRNLVRR